MERAVGHRVSFQKKKQVELMSDLVCKIPLHRFQIPIFPRRYVKQGSIINIYSWAQLL